MSTTIRHGDIGLDDARRMRDALATELRDTRVGLAISQHRVAQAADLSRAQVGRLERGEIEAPDIVQICRCARALGLRASLKLYPVGVPVRDAAHLALLARFEALLASPLTMHREVGLPGAGDGRAWDAVVEGDRKRAAAEVETRLGDVQAVSRRASLKQRDDPRVELVILVVGRTRHNAAVLREHRAALRSQFPLDSPDIRRALLAGRLPDASGILML